MRRSSFWAGVREHWLEGMSGAVSVPFMIAAVLAGEAWATVLLMMLGYASLLFAAWRLWDEQRQKVSDLEVRLAPRIRLFLDPSCNGVRTVGSKIFQNGTLLKSKWVQVMVAPIGEAPLLECAVQLLRVSRIGTVLDEMIISEPLFCHWSNREHTDHTIRIDCGISHPANLIAAYPNQPLGVKTWPVKYDLIEALKQPGKYRFEIQASAKDAQPTNASVVLDWAGSYDSISVRMEN